MNIAVNARLLLKGKLEGIGWFAAETLKRISRSHPEHQFLFLFDRPFSEEFIFSGNITPVVVPPRARHPFLWYKWFEYSVPPVLRKERADIFFSPDGYLSLSSEVPAHAVIHDINFMHHPDFHPWLTGKYYRHFFPGFAARAGRLATVSNYSKTDICRSFGIPDDRIDVVYNGAHQVFSPLPEDEKPAAKLEFAQGHDYFLYVGSFHKRKNICGLLLAFDIFREESGREIKLVLAGERLYRYPRMDRVLAGMRFRKDVMFPGRIEPDSLRRAYGASLALVYIPWYEGFGIPVLEAMNCDTPVIASDRTSLPEVCGDAAHLVDPGDIGSVVEGMMRVASDENHRKTLTARARIRKRQFSWDRTADLLWKSIEMTSLSKTRHE
jgi:glycosyltransferase involved in cell wall biosynthesis